MIHNINIILTSTYKLPYIDYLAPTINYSYNISPRNLAILQSRISENNIMYNIYSSGSFMNDSEYTYYVNLDRYKKFKFLVIQKCDNARVLTIDPMVVRVSNNYNNISSYFERHFKPKDEELRYCEVVTGLDLTMYKNMKEILSGEY